MARKRGKEADSRGTLLGAAWALLLERGAGGMSVEAIVGRAGLSKGTFFHFFPTKQDLLDALCARIAEESWKQTGAVLERGDLDPLARLDRFLQASRVWRSEHSKAVGSLWLELARPENAALLSKVRSLGVQRLAPILVRLIREANDHGTTRVEDVETVAHLALEWMYATVEGSLRLFARSHDSDAIAHALRRANATMDALEKILGAPAGSFQRVSGEIVGRLAAGVPLTDEDTPAGQSISTGRPRRAAAGRPRRAAAGRAKPRPQRGRSRHGPGNPEA